MEPTLQGLLMLAMFLDGDETILDQIPKAHVSVLMWWIAKELLEEKIMKLDDWYELAFHLCKQRFDVTMDWMEEQSVSRIMLMSRVVTKFVEKQNREMKKASRKRR